LTCFSDFRSGGYRVLSDLLFDIQQENEQQKKRQLHRPETQRYLMT
jgi:hypothetical protein